MQGPCDFYDFKVWDATSKQIQPGGGHIAKDIRRIEWCNHPKHSPCKRQEAVAISGKKLRCGGDLAQCEIPDKYEDQSHEGEAE